MKTSGYIVLTLKFLKEGNRWTALCVELGTATFGRSIHEADERIREAVLLHLNTLEDVGECERFLTEHSVTFYPHKPRKEEIMVCPSHDRGTFFSAFVSPLSKPLRA